MREKTLGGISEKWFLQHTAEALHPAFLCCLYWVRCLSPCMEHRGGGLNGQAGARGAAGHLGKGDFQLNLRVEGINY